MDLSTVKWRKSAHSQGSSNNCVEVARLGGMIAIRDSKNPDGRVLVCSLKAWQRFIRDLKVK
ncbi:DUF397 domain-containing protein [Thermopolyspora sp. NPDC052614]|uniref:DUF397 domain-containing protein n=1 Tax=Thermopolyspora sp. NPDC052614 TaxID=3155682 RepID=UPI00341E673E